LALIAHDWICCYNARRPRFVYIAGGAFIFAFPIGGLLGARFGPRVPLLVAAALQLINALVIIFLTPESNTKPVQKLSLKQANPVGGLIKLFGRSHLLRVASAAYFLASLARGSLDAQFANYSSIRFGWTQAQSGPILVLVGLTLAIMPRIVVPILGLKNAILAGLLLFSMGLTATGLAPTPLGFGASILLVAIGCICLPALQALLANLAEEGERGALLGAVGSLTELTGSIGSTLYGKFSCYRQEGRSCHGWFKTLCDSGMSVGSRSLTPALVLFPFSFCH
jgi:MFS transporter, DHA1 family, tetracycline resistance protein